MSRHLISVTEAGNRLGFNEKTIRRYIAAGRLTGYRIGPRALRVDAAEVEALAQPVPAAATAAAS